MQIGFFTVFRSDPQHYLHAVALVASARRVMPSIPITQFTDDRSPIVPGVDAVRRLPSGPLLERRLEHYAACTGDWLLVDTDVELRADVSAVFPATPFDLALTDRAWQNLPQGDLVMQTMPFNTGVVFTRNPLFWQDVLATWRAADNKDWMSEQRAVYQVVRTGKYLVQILPGQVYNCPPSSPDDPCSDAKMLHYKGPRKAWWTARYYQSCAGASADVSGKVLACV
jgi:hypothetical protein